MLWRVRVDGRDRLPGQPGTQRGLLLAAETRQSSGPVYLGTGRAV